MSDMTNPRADHDDLQTHRAAWRHGLEIAYSHAEVSPPDIDDKSYWQHEIAVFDQAFAAYDLSVTTPAPEAVAGLEARARDIWDAEVRKSGFIPCHGTLTDRMSVRAITAAIAQQPTREELLRLVRGCNKRHGMYGYREQDCEEAADAILALIGRAS